MFQKRVGLLPRIALFTKLMTDGYFDQQQTVPVVR